MTDNVFAGHANPKRDRTSARAARAAIARRGAALMLAMAVAACADAGPDTAPLQANQTKLHGMLVSGTAVLGRDSVTAAASIVATLTVTNEADTTGHLSWGVCPSNGPLVVFAYDAGHTAPVWNATAAYRQVLCLLIAYGADLAPGQTWHHTTTVPVSDILGDSLPAGRYRITGSAKWLDPGFPQELTLGELDLTR